MIFLRRAFHYIIYFESCKRQWLWNNLIKYRTTTTSLRTFIKSLKCQSLSRWPINHCNLFFFVSTILFGFIINCNSTNLENIFSCARNATFRHWLIIIIDEDERSSCWTGNNRSLIIVISFSFFFIVVYMCLCFLFYSIFLIIERICMYLNLNLNWWIWPSHNNIRSIRQFIFNFE